MDIKYLHRQYVAGLGVRHCDGAGERVEAVPVKSVEDVYGGVWPYLSVGDLAGVVDDRVFRLDREYRLLLVVPNVVDPIFWKVMRLWHAANLLVVHFRGYSLNSRLLFPVRQLQALEEGLSMSRAAILKGGELPWVALCREASVPLYAVRTRPLARSRSEHRQAPCEQGFPVLPRPSFDPKHPRFHRLLGAESSRGHRKEGPRVAFDDQVGIRGRALPGLRPFPAVPDPQVKRLPVDAELVGTRAPAPRPQRRPHRYRSPASSQLVPFARRVQKPRPPPREGHDHRLELPP